MVDNTKIFTWRVSGKGIHGVKSFEETILHHTRSLQSLAFDPTETLVAGSDSLGRILIWKNVGENMIELSREITLPRASWTRIGGFMDVMMQQH